MDEYDLAEKRGCNEYNPCWQQCVEAARKDIELEEQGKDDAKVVVHNIWTSRDQSNR